MHKIKTIETALERHEAKDRVPLNVREYPDARMSLSPTVHAKIPGTILTLFKGAKYFGTVPPVGCADISGNFFSRRPSHLS